MNWSSLSRIHTSAGCIAASGCVVLVLAVAVFLAFLGLVSLGPWMDEFYLINHVHSYGLLGSFTDRLLNWSPRPVSQFLLYLYCFIDDKLQEPLVSYFLIPLWLILATCVLVPGYRSLSRTLVAATLLALLFIGHPVAEVFYWPAGAAAYVPTLAGIAWILCASLGEGDDAADSTAWLVLAAVAVALSSEIGAMFALIYIPARVLVKRRIVARHYLAMIMAWLVAILVVTLSYYDRIVLVKTSISSVSGRIWRYLPEYLMNLPYELLQSDQEASANVRLFTGVVIKMIFFAAVYFVMSNQSREKRGGEEGLAVGIASFGAAALSLAASLYAFSHICCERQGTMQQCFVIIGLAGLAQYAATRWPVSCPAAAVPLCALSILLPLWIALPKLIHDYAQFWLRYDAAEMTWRSGHSQGDSMTLAYVRPGKIVGGVLHTRGFSDDQNKEIFYYTRKKDTLNDQILLFFNKQQLLISKPLDPK